MHSNLPIDTFPLPLSSLEGIKDSIWYPGHGPELQVSTVQLRLPE